MKPSLFSVALSFLSLLPLALPVGADEEKEDGSGIGLAKSLLGSDAELLEDADALVEDTLEQTLVKNEDDKSSQSVLAEMKALWAIKPLPIADEKELHGDWKVRSLQAAEHGAFSYPFFDCRIFPEAKALVFHKAKGSQRRMGFLERDSEKRFLFAGATYFSYDPAPRLYKGKNDKVADEDLDRNAVGWLYKIGDKRLLVVFPTVYGNLEFYEMKK
jgi:hypothetical protein